MDLVYPNETRLFRIALTLALIAWAVIILGTFGIALLYVGLFFLFAIFVQAGFITHVRGNGIRITEEQYPDLYAQLQHCCEVTGVDTPPETYLLRTDFFNALATRFLRRHYIVLFTDVVDALKDQPEAVNFYIGHELGHIHRKHIRWGWVLAPVLWLPLLGSSYRRAEEYTCDRYGNACCESSQDATMALAAIVAGDTRWKTLNITAYLQQVDTTGGFFMSLNEFTSDYPWLCKRMAWISALRQNETPEFPRRSFWAGLMSTFVPSVPGGIVPLLMVVAVLGILAAIALPAYQDYIERAEELAAGNTPTQQVEPIALPDVQGFENLLGELGPLRDQVEGYYAKHQAYPSTFVELGWETETLYTEQHNAPVNLYDSGVIAVGFGDDDTAVYFVNEPSIDAAGELQWYCFGQNIDDVQLPPICQSAE